MKKKIENSTKLEYEQKQRLLQMLAESKRTTIYMGLIDVAIIAVLMLITIIASEKGSALLSVLGGLIIIIPICICFIIMYVIQARSIILKLAKEYYYYNEGGDIFKLSEKDKKDLPMPW